jgi:glucose-1-phosphate cytidylyltransferase
MKVVILCGGLGTRMREETEFKPKPLVDVGGRPILWHIMKYYAHYGFKDFILCLGYKGQMIKEYFLNYEAMNRDFTIRLGAREEITYHGDHEESDFRVTLVDTGQDNMTGARVKAVERYIDGDSFMVTYGDGLSDVNLHELLAFHKGHGRLASVTTVRPYSRYGIVDVEDGGRVVEFREKPQVDGWASVGFFVFQRGIFKYLSDDPGCILERAPLEHLAADHQLGAYQHAGFFYAMDTFREYQYLNEQWSSGEAPWAVWKR